MEFYRVFLREVHKRECLWKGVVEENRAGSGVFGAADTRSEMFLWGGGFAVCWVKSIFVFFIELK